MKGKQPWNDGGNHEYEDWIWSRWPFWVSCNRESDEQRKRHLHESSLAHTMTLPSHPQGWISFSYPKIKKMKETGRRKTYEMENSEKILWSLRKHQNSFRLVHLSFISSSSSSSSSYSRFSIPISSHISLSLLLTTIISHTDLFYSVLFSVFASWIWFLLARIQIYINFSSSTIFQCGALVMISFFYSRVLIIRRLLSVEFINENDLQIIRGLNKK